MIILIWVLILMTSHYLPMSPKQSQVHFYGKAHLHSSYIKFRVITIRKELNLTCELILIFCKIHLVIMKIICVVQFLFCGFYSYVASRLDAFRMPVIPNSVVVWLEGLWRKRELWVAAKLRGIKRLNMKETDKFYSFDLRSKLYTSNS